MIQFVMFSPETNRYTDDETDFLRVTREFLFFNFARDTRLYLKDIHQTPRLFYKLGKRNLDVFTFVDRSWCKGTHQTSPRANYKIHENVLFLHLKTYDDWWNRIGKKSRNMVRKATKSGLQFMQVEPNDKIACDILRIYKSSCVKQGRRNYNFDVTLDEVKAKISLSNRVIIGAFFQNELVGFATLLPRRCNCLCRHFGLNGKTLEQGSK